MYTNTKTKYSNYLCNLCSLCVFWNSHLGSVLIKLQTHKNSIKNRYIKGGKTGYSLEREHIIIVLKTLEALRLSLKGPVYFASNASEHARL